MGIVESVGSDVKNIKPGDRVVSSFEMGCGQCFYCKVCSSFTPWTIASSFADDLMSHEAANVL